MKTVPWKDSRYLVSCHGAVIAWLSFFNTKILMEDMQTNFQWYCERWRLLGLCVEGSVDDITLCLNFLCVIHELPSNHGIICRHPCQFHSFVRKVSTTECKSSLATHYEVGLDQTCGASCHHVWGWGRCGWDRCGFNLSSGWWSVN